ncbi:MAG TPA: hypothetical protein VG848_15460 [Acetobacteraceae bacterium]|jgi:hypothetical protein|nr:hypothetical protein [Acetobacteraceae bacterium]
MRILIPAIAGAALLAGAALAFSPLAGAQPAPAAGGAPAQVVSPPAGPPLGPPAGPMANRPGGGAWMPGMPGMGMPMMHGPAAGAGPEAWAGPWMRRHAMHALFAWRETWGLFHRPADLGLSPSDVQIIAEAILLRNGEHDWKVGDVTQNADHTVSFAFVTAHGDVVARFTINTSNGRITRTS